MSGKKITKGTIIGYIHVQKLLTEFENKNEVKLRIQLLHRTSLRILQREKNYWSRFFLHFTKFLYRDKNYFDNYVANVFKIMKTFFNYLEREKGYVIGNYHKSFRIPLRQAAPAVLTPAQLQFLITNREFEKTLNPFLKRAKDIFVFGCTVGLRYSDLMKLRKTNLIMNGKDTYLILFTQKTGTEIKIPLPDYALEIVTRNKRKAGKYILPRLSSTNFNLQIKKLIKAAGWNYTQPKYVSCQGRMIELKNNAGETWQFNEHITAHTMRRTAITTLLILGGSESVVRKLSGHATGSKEFYRYVSIAQEYMNQEVKKAYQKLLEIPAI